MCGPPRAAVGLLWPTALGLLRGQLGLLLSSLGLLWGCCGAAGEGRNHSPAKSPFGAGWKMHKVPALRCATKGRDVPEEPFRGSGGTFTGPNGSFRSPKGYFLGPLGGSKIIPRGVPPGGVQN